MTFTWDRPAALELEKDLVEQCRQSAEAMGAMLCVVGQRKAKGSGTTKGFPDLVLLDHGHIKLIEAKRGKTPDTPHGTLNNDQAIFIGKALAHQVKVEVIDSVQQFEAIVNSCRR